MLIHGLDPWGRVPRSRLRVVLSHSWPLCCVGLVHGSPLASIPVSLYASPLENLASSCSNLYSFPVLVFCPSHAFERPEIVSSISFRIRAGPLVVSSWFS